MRCKQTCTQLLGSTVFPFLLGLLWQELSTALDAEEDKSHNLEKADCELEGCWLLTTWRSHRTSVSYIQWSLILMDLGLFSVAVYLMWGFVDSPVGKLGWSDLIVEGRSRRYPGLGLMSVHVCSCHVLSPGTRVWDPPAHTALKSWVVLCVSVVGRAWGGARSPSSFRAKPVLAREGFSQDQPEDESICRGVFPKVAWDSLSPFHRVHGVKTIFIIACYLPFPNTLRTAALGFP